MNIPNNSIFLAYSQAAVKRLPTAIAQTLTAFGSDVFMDTSHFLSREAPSPEVLSEISKRTYYVLLLTPASLLWGLDPDATRLKGEIKCAKDNHCQIIILCGYGYTPQQTGMRWSHSGLPDDAKIEHIDYQNLVQEIQRLAATIDKRASDTGHDPIEINTHKLRAEALLDRGLTENYDASLYNRESTAIVFFNEALAIDPEYADAHFQRAEFKYFRANPDGDRDRLFTDALNDYNQAIQLNPSEARYYAGRAGLHCRLKSLEAALTDYTLAIANAPKAARYYRLRASVYSRLDRLDDAIKDLTAAIQLQPNEASYYKSRSGVYFVKGDYQSALQDLTKAIDIYPRRVPTQWYVMCGFLHRDLGFSDKAEQDWNMAVEVAYHKDKAYSLKARMHMSRGEFTEARSAANAALEINPDNQAAQSVIIQIENR